jgi:hypothetical protein
VPTAQVTSGALIGGDDRARGQLAWLEERSASPDLPLNFRSRRPRPAACAPLHPDVPMHVARRGVVNSKPLLLRQRQ